MCFAEQDTSKKYEMRNTNKNSRRVRGRELRSIGGLDEPNVQGTECKETISLLKCARKT